MHKHALASVSVWIALLAAPLPSGAGDSPVTILVIGHNASTATVMSRDELRPIFQTRKNTWPDGSPARPFNLPETDPTRHGFDASVLGLDADLTARYWIDRKIRGGERQPQVVPSGSAMMKVVSKTPGAIGYVDASIALDANVRVVAKVVAGQVVKP